MERGASVFLLKAFFEGRRGGGVDFLPEYSIFRGEGEGELHFSLEYGVLRGEGARGDQFFNLNMAFFGRGRGDVIYGGGKVDSVPTAEFVGYCLGCDAISGMALHNRGR